MAKISQLPFQILNSSSYAITITEWKIDCEVKIHSSVKGLDLFEAIIIVSSSKWLQLIAWLTTTSLYLMLKVNILVIYWQVKSFICGTSIKIVLTSNFGFYELSMKFKSIYEK